MLDIKFVRNNPEVVKQNIKNKFQDEKLPLVDEVIELDKRNREIKQEVEALRADKNQISKQIGACMAQGKKEEAEELKKKVQENADRVEALSKEEKEVEAKIKQNMMIIPNIIDPSVPIGKDDSENVEIERFGEPVVPDFEIPYHTDIMESFNGIDLESAGKVAGNGFYYLMGDIARLHSAVLAYARDFMINRGFTYCVPPFMIRSNVVTGVMSFAEMDAMMYKIEGEDLYLIGTSEHSMIGKFIDTMLTEDQLPQTLTSYSPCFRKEKGAHGIEERGVYRIHQFEKQEMIVVCKPEESKMWYDKLWQNTVDLFRSMDIPVRTLECCSGDLADLESAGKVAGNGFYYLMGDIARLHSAVLAYARDFMINRGFTYCVPPFMIRSNVVTGVMSFAEMDAMMYKIEGEDLYLIGTSEHSMIGKFIDTMLTEDQLPQTLTSYSPCFRKEKGAHGIEERGVYRIHQFEKQEMIVVCKPEESKMWYDKLWQNTVDLFRSMDIPVRTLECCSGDLADLKVKSCDVEAWSPRQKKYFEVGSCSNLGDAQARRLGIRVKDADGNKYFANTLNNTVVAPPRMLIAFLENNLQADGSVRIPEVLRPYMGGMTEIKRK